MGFRFRNFNSIYRTYINARSPRSNKTYYPSIQSLNSQFQDQPSSVFSSNYYYKVPVRWHLGHSHDHQHHPLSEKEGENIFRLGLGADMGLAVGKALTGYVSGSTALIADAAHSVSDVVSNWSVWNSFNSCQIYYVAVFSLLLNFLLSGSKCDSAVVIQSGKGS